MSEEILVKKRCGKTETFNKTKVEKAILKAMRTGSGIYKKKLAELIADEAEAKFKKKAEITSEDLDNYVQKSLDAYGQGLTAQAYVKYRALKDYRKQDNEIVETVMGIVHQTNEELINENANKNFRAYSTQRDLAAGEVSKLIARHIIPEHLLLAHQSGVIHIHDLDYFGGVGDKDGLQSGIFNCCLVNLEDMLVNGTVINNKRISDINSFNKACTIASQIALTVSSGQYGGQSMSVSHLAPFLRKSRERWRGVVTKGNNNNNLTELQVENIIDNLVKKELSDGIKTLNYQLNTFVSSNGQTPFISLFLYLNEKPEYIKETAMIIEEIFKQRIKGMPNRYGYNTVQTFPKLIYVLDENNIEEGSEYWGLSKLAAECISKTMVPDLISAKVMKKYHNGNVFPCMGCTESGETVIYKQNDTTYYESIGRMWNRMASSFAVKNQQAQDCYYIDLDGVEIYDSTSNGFVECKRIIKNKDKGDWRRIKISNGRVLTCTSDHPLAVVGKGRTYVKDIKIGDEIECTSSVPSNTTNPTTLDPDYAWLLGTILCNGCYDRQLSSTFAMTGEDDVIERYVKAVVNNFNGKITTKALERGVKGNCKEIRWLSDGNSDAFTEKLIELFGGLQKTHRQIPNIIFNSDRETKLNFLGGMIDADGYITKDSVIELRSTNKELALQTLMLIDSLGYNGKISPNYYKDSSKIRYSIVFDADEDIVNHITCEEKKKNYVKKNKQERKEYKVTEILDLGSTGEYSYDVTTSSDRFDVSGIASHNCRSFLSDWKDPETGEWKYYGRFNKGVQSINLPDVALSSKGDFDSFWEILEERLELCREVGELRVKSMVKNAKNLEGSPIHWKYGALARKKDGEDIIDLLEGGYSTTSLGFIGMYEMCMAMLGKSNTTEEGKEFCLKVSEFMKKKTEEWNKVWNVGWSLYSTPSEGYCETSYKKTKERFGEVEGVTDHGFFSNSYHVYVNEEIDAFSKLDYESAFQKLASGGAISYVEVGNLVGNQEVILEILKHIYDNIQYAELNTECDRCNDCGSTSPLGQDENNNFFCKECGSYNVEAVRRICGYLGVASNGINASKRKEMADRVKHI